MAKDDQKPSGIRVKKIVLHQASTIDQKTEKSWEVKGVKTPSIQSMEWAANGSLLRVVGKETHYVPAAAVADSIAE